MRILGLDYGTKRVGVAVCDPDERMALGIKTIEAEKFLSVLPSLIVDYQIKKIVVGLPRNMNHSLGASAQNAMTLAEQIKTTTGLPVELWDERLSSVSASQMLTEAGFSSKKQKGMIDQSAAQIILQHYLDSHKK